MLLANSGRLGVTSAFETWGVVLKADVVVWAGYGATGGAAFKEPWWPQAVNASPPLRKPE